jgi:hypothetical protein
VNVRKLVAAILVILAFWMGGYAFFARDPDATAYRETCVQSAQGALDGLGTARMATHDQVFGTYRTAMMDDAQKLIGQARGAMAGRVPPDEASIRRRDALVPLLDQAEKIYEDLANDRADAQALQPVEQQLRDFIDGNR